MAKPDGFSYQSRKNGDIIIFHHGRRAVVLRGHQADRFVAKLADSDPQELMARFTGNYKRGNER